MTSAALAISGAKFFNITIAPAANYSYSVTGLGMTLGSSGTGPNNWGVYAGAPGFTASTSLATGSWTAGNTTAIAPTLSGLTGLTTATEIRVYAWGASASGGTFGPGNSQPLNVNGAATLRSAGTLIWDGGQGNANWNSYTATAANQSNWNLNNLPTTSLVDALQFAGTTQTTTTNNIAGLTVGSITFNSGAGAFVNGGANAVTLNGNITNSSSNLQTINHGLTLSNASHTFDTGASGLTIGTAAIIGSGASITKSGTGILTLTTSNTYSGGTTVSDGTLIANNSAGTSATGTGAVSVSASGKLGGSGQVGLVTNTTNFTNSGTLFAGQSGAVDAQVLRVTTTGAINLGGTVSLDVIGGANSGSANDQTGNNDKLIFSATALGGDGGPVITGSLQINTNISTTTASLWAEHSSWDLFDWANVTGAFTNLSVSGDMTGNVAGLPDLASIGLAWDWTNLYSTGVISIVAVPEPGRASLLLLACGALTLRRRRR